MTSSTEPTIAELAQTLRAALATYVSTCTVQEAEQARARVALAAFDERLWPRVLLLDASTREHLGSELVSYYEDVIAPLMPETKAPRDPIKFRAAVHQGAQFTNLLSDFLALQMALYD